MILTCRQLVERVTDKRENKLSRIDRMGWAAHLAWCTTCRVYVEQMDRTVEALRAMSVDEAPKGRAPDDARAAAIAIFRARGLH